MSKIKVLDDALYSALLTREVNKNKFLFLEPHDKLQRQWKVESFDDTATMKLDGAISPHGTVPIWGYDGFAEACEAIGYTPVFMDDPSAEFDWFESLNNDPGVEVNSKLEGRIDRNGNPLRLVRGFLPFQARGLNWMKSTERMIFFRWSTGTGKTLAAEGTILVKRQGGYGPDKTEGYDLTLYCVKPNNLVDSRRKLKEHTGLDARILSGTPKRRERIFAEAAQAIQNGEQPILIFNAEKFREDTEYLKLLVEGHNLLVIFDEMPSKYANRTTKLYSKTAEVLYTSFSTPSRGKRKGQQVFYPRNGKERAKQMFMVAMSATPIYNSPQDVFNCVRMGDTSIFGSIDNFENTFVGGRDQWGQVTRWKNLDLMGSMMAHIFHDADKVSDPEIKAQFPEKLPPETVYCDLDPNSEKLYSKLQKEYAALTKGQLSALKFQEILAAIGCFQMIVDNPRGVLQSAKTREQFEIARDKFILEGHTEEELKAFDKKYKDGSEVALKLRKLVDDDSKFTDADKNGNCIISKMLELRDRLDQHDGKAIVFSTKTDTLLPYIAEWFDKWGITYTLYHGGLTPNQKQAAKDSFRNDPSVKVFLSSDAGSDSIDLPEASLTIHYNRPWTDAALQQRENRQDRIDSEQDVVQVITLAAPFTVEDRKTEILETKKGYFDKVFKGDIADMNEAASKRSDFLYILTGEHAA